MSSDPIRMKNWGTPAAGPGTERPITGEIRTMTSLGMGGK
jgi:hypothetical protein